MTPFGESKSARVPQLSKRRREVLELLAKGLTNSEIGCAMGIAEGTVRVHVTAVLAHLEVTNRTEAAAVWVRHESQPTAVERVLARPAIAVLPLAATTEDPRTRSIAAGVTSDLTDLFSRWCWFPVIARSSIRARRENESDAAFAQQLGARFLVNGELSRRNDTLCLVLRVDDIQGNVCVWSERRIITETSLFSARDELCAELVAAAYPVLVARTQTELTRSAPPESLEAWAKAHMAMAMHVARDPVSSERAQGYLAQALADEPTLVLAHYAQGLVAFDSVVNQWGPQALAMNRLERAAEHCLSLAPHAAEGHYLLGRLLVSRGEVVHAIVPLEAALARNPSFAQAHALLAQTLQIAGRDHEALTRMKHAARLGPRSFVAGLALLHFMREEYEQAWEASELAVATNPRYAFARVMAAASAWWLEQDKRASAHLIALKHDSPTFNSARFLSTFGKHFGSVGRIGRAIEALEGNRPSHRRGFEA